MRPLVLAAGLIAFAAAFPSTRPVSASEPVPVAGPPCVAPAEFAGLDQPLMRTALAIASGDPVVIVALGSSSTAGSGATSPAHSYPAQLEAHLRQRFPGTSITVVNRGVGGEDAREMLLRLADQVIQERPDMVIWQVGTNAVLSDYVVSGEAKLLNEGIRRLKASSADVVLMDAQYAPKVLAKAGHNEMLELLASTARSERIALFHRFAIMKHWVEKEKIPVEAMLSPDLLHMNDWSYACIGKLFADAVGYSIRGAASAAVGKRPQR